MFSMMYNPPFNQDNTNILQVLFDYHAVFMVSAQIVLVLYYPRNYNKVRIETIILLAAFALAVLLVAFIKFDTYNVVEFMGALQLISMLLKYIPQVLLNRERASTLGWSIKAVLLDLTGLIFNFLIFIITQFAVESSELRTDKLRIFKFLLMISLIGFDIIFLFHHYVLYTHKQVEKDQSQVTSEDSLVRGAKQKAASEKMRTKELSEDK